MGGSTNRSKKASNKDPGNKKPAKTSKNSGGVLDVQNAQKLDLEVTTSVDVAAQSNQIVICRQSGCHDISTTKGYCRFHFLATWKRGKSKEAKKHGQELDAYLTELSRKFPEEFLERLRTEIDELIEKDRAEDSDETQDRSGLFDALEGDEDIDTIIKGLKVEDY